jgi:hypothetical protein
MNRKMHVGFGAVAAFLCIFGAAQNARATTGQLDKPASAGAVVLGEWNSGFDACYSYATTKKIPLLVFWGKTGCGFCNAMIAGFNTSEFTTWQAKQKIVMCYIHASDADPQTEARSFSRNGTGLYPYVRIYWPAGKVSVTFSGRKGAMPVKTGTIAGQFTASVDQALAAYNEGASEVYTYKGGAFLVPGTSGARLEAEAGVTSYVDVPLVRTAEAAASVATNRLAVGTSTQNVFWAAGETNKMVRCAIPSGTAAGTALAMSLYDAVRMDKGVQGTSAITVVSPVANSPTNPLWIGERTAATLAAGEWTMDLDVATNRTARQTGKAYTLAMVGGELWCPDCFGADTLLAAAAFKQWATDNNVALVLLDNPAKGMRAPTLLRHEVYTNSTSSAGYGKSGSAYLSRKMADAAQAEAVAQRNYDITTSLWKPRSSTAFRLDNPTMVLIRKDGTIAGRLAYDETGSRTFPLETNMLRLNEFLSLADDPAEEGNGDLATTALGIGPKASASGEIQASDLIDFWKLTNIVTGVRTRLTLSGAAADVSMALLQVSGGATNTLASVSGSREASLTLTADVTAAGPCYVSVAGNPATTFAPTSAVSTVCAYTLSSSFILLPQDAAGQYAYSDGGTVSIALEAGKLYRLSGFGNLAGVAGLTAGEGFYSVSASKIYELPLLAGSGVATYAVWNPGRVGFTETAQRMSETAGSGYVVAARTGGSSGACMVHMALDTSASTASNDVRFVWNDADFVWSDGESGPKTNFFTLVKDNVFQGEQQFVVKLTRVGGSITIGADTETVTIFDTDDPVFGAESYGFTLYTKVGFSRSLPVNGIRQNASVSLNKVSGSLPRGITAAYDKAGKAVVFSGTPSATGTYAVSYTVTERRTSGVATGTATTFTFVVKDISDVNAGYGRAQSYVGCPVYLTSGGESVLAGTLDFTATVTGRLTARYLSTGHSTMAFSLTGWNGFDEGTGVLTATFPARYGCTLVVTMDGDGTLSGTITDPGNAFADVSSSLKADFVARGDAAPYAGYYTVTLPYTESDFNTPAGLVSTNGDGQAVAASGTGYLTLKMNAPSAIRASRVTYAGVLANGTMISGSAYLLPAGAGKAALPIFRRLSRELFGTALSVRANAAQTYQSDPQVVLAQPGVIPYWVHTQGAYSYRVTYAVYGGYYNTTELLSDCCVETYNTTVMHFRVGDEVVPTASQLYGEIASVPETVVSVSNTKLTLASRPNNLSLSFSKSTGIFRGTFRITFSSGRSILATYRGVLLPGWTSCGCGEEDPPERPFGSGSCWFADRYNGLSVKRGMSVDLKPAAE